MILTKSMIDNFIKCPFLFGKNVVNNKYDEKIKHKESIDALKKYLVEIASYEMKENDKLSLAEYRVKYTNKYFSDKDSISAVLDPHVLVSRLNNLFSIFADNIFIGYNVPIDIPITGTNITYRDIIDFSMINEDGSITLIEFFDFDDQVDIKDKLKYWTHYYTSYSFMAYSFNTEVNVVIIDPDVNDRVEMKILPSKFESDYQELCDLVTPIKSYYLYKNLYACKSCILYGSC